MNRSTLLALSLVFLVGLTLSSALIASQAAIELEANKDESVIVQSILANNNSNSQEFVFIVQIEDRYGAVEFLDYQTGVIKPIEKQTASITWEPQDNGIHVVKTLVWTELDSPKEIHSMLRELRIDSDEETKVICTGSALCFTGTVTKIVDGDTLDVGDIRIRLSLVDTPERGEPGYSEATNFTAELCPLGSAVVVDQDDGQLVDVYGRLVGKVTCHGNKVLNAELLDSQHAVPFTAYCATSEFSNDGWLSAACDGISHDGTLDGGVDCDPSYPDVCIPSPPPDLDCRDISFRNFRVVGSDPHRFDIDHNGIGCES